MLRVDYGLMRYGRRELWIGAVALACVCRPAAAGMPSFVLTDLVRMRVEILSFFLVMLVGSAVGVRWIWNSLRKDFPKLPKMSFKGAAALTALWGMLFLLVLTMISGARELMTPGAWEPNGATYKLKDAGETTIEGRREKLKVLKAALWEYARGHDGRFPADVTDEAVPGWMWESGDLTRARFVYVAGRKVRDAGIVVIEPTVFPSPRLVLLGDGTITTMGDGEIESALRPAAGGGK